MQKDIDNISSEQPLLELRGAALTVRRTEVTDIHWQVRPGERWVVSGLQASGKTSLLKVAAGLQVPSKGVLELFGTDYWTANDEVKTAIRRKISFIFNDGNRLVSSFTVAENVALPICYHENKNINEVKDAVFQVLSYLNILPIANLYPTELELHQRRIISIAQGIFIRPQLIFVDDPGDGLDVVQWNQFKNLLLSFSSGMEQFGIPPAGVVVTAQDLRLLSTFGTHYGILTQKGFLTFDGLESMRFSEDPTVQKLFVDWSKK